MDSTSIIHHQSSVLILYQPFVIDQIIYIRKKKQCVSAENNGQEIKKYGFCRFDPEQKKKDHRNIYESSSSHCRSRFGCVVQNLYFISQISFCLILSQLYDLECYQTHLLYSPFAVVQGADFQPSRERVLFCLICSYWFSFQAVWFRSA